MASGQRHARLVGILAVALLSAGCDHGRRIASLEERATVADQEISRLTEEVGVLRGRVDRGETSINRFALDLNYFRQVITGRSRLTATVELNEWRTVYANSVGKSQMVRLTHRQSAGTGRLEIRLIPIRRPVEAGSPTASPVLPPIVTPDGPAWDLSPVGAQRSQRLPCGYEIQARGEGGPHVIDILVLEDPRPVSCDG
jgi:hypothetical protein